MSTRPPTPCRARRRARPPCSASATGVETHDVALVLGSGWLPAVDALGEATAELEHDRPARLRAAGRGRATPARSASVRAGRPRTCWSSWAAPTSTRAAACAAVVHGVRTAAAAGCRAVVLTNGCGGLDETWQPGTPVLISDHINLTGDLADRGRELRRPHRPLQQPAARAVPRGRPGPRRGRLRAVPRPALRDPGRDPDGPRASAATWSACPPRSRRSPPARPAWRCSASRWSPTSPPASPASRSTTRRSSRPAGAAATRMGELLGKVVPRL